MCFIRLIHIMDFGIVCIGDMQSAKISFIGNICRWHWHPVKSMMIIKKVDVFPAVQSNTKVSYMYFIRQLQIMETEVSKASVLL